MHTWRLIAKVFQHVNYAGEYRWLHQDVPSFGDVLGFNDKVSSIVVYRAPNYLEGDKIRFYQHANYQGGYLELGPGNYPNIHVQPLSFGDKISSADFYPVGIQPVASAVRLEVHIFQHVNYAGQMREILFSEPSLPSQGFNDKVSSIRIFAGPSYEAGYVANFFQHVNYAGGMLQPGYFGPGTAIPNLKSPPYAFNDVISSVKISMGAIG